MINADPNFSARAKHAAWLASWSRIHPDDLTLNDLLEQPMPATPGQLYDLSQILVSIETHPHLMPEVQDAAHSLFGCLFHDLTPDEFAEYDRELGRLDDEFGVDLSDEQVEQMKEGIIAKRESIEDMISQTVAAIQKAQAKDQLIDA